MYVFLLVRCQVAGIGSKPFLVFIFKACSSEDDGYLAQTAQVQKAEIVSGYVFEAQMNSDIRAICQTPLQTLHKF